MVFPHGGTPDGITQSVNLGLECASQSPLLQFKCDPPAIRGASWMGAPALPRDRPTPANEQSKRGRRQPRQVPNINTEDLDTHASTMSPSHSPNSSTRVRKNPNTNPPP
ncbi:hypothetical protein CRENBAI_024651 [Crenichthys baileyi]|uniref:Uncharacterized protein n=1 Tax=Crenichthys baileyi TaxID=28760 RepID=A0AAV9RL66_9TELE